MTGTPTSLGSLSVIFLRTCSFWAALWPKPSPALTKMRGTRSLPAPRPTREVAAGTEAGDAELASVLREVAAELRAVRCALAREEGRDG